MKRRYREKIYTCGDYKDIQLFPVFEKAKGRRKKRSKPTSEMQTRLNQRNAERNLTRLLNANFTENDISLTLTFKNEHLPKTYDEAERMAKNLLRRLKRLRGKKSLPEMKYIIIPGAGRFHFHIPMSGGIDDKTLQDMWPYGYCNIIHFIFDENGIEGHARYVAKQFELDDIDIFSMFDIDEETGEVTEKEGKSVTRSKGKRRYTCSRNIIRPEPEEKDGRISAARVEEIATVDSASRAVFEKLYPGYCLADCKPYYNEENGGYYLEIKMYKKDSSFLKRKRERTRYGPNRKICA